MKNKDKENIKMAMNMVTFIMKIASLTLQVWDIKAINMV